MSFAVKRSMLPFCAFALVCAAVAASAALPSVALASDSGVSRGAETIVLSGDVQGALELDGAASEISIDLGGFAVDGGEGPALVVDSPVEGLRITVKNGTLRGGSAGIVVAAPVRAADISVSDVRVEAQGCAILICGDAAVSIIDSEIAGDCTGIEVAAGGLRLDGRTLVDGGHGKPSVEGGDGGATARNAALAVCCRDASRPVSVDISSATLNGAAALLQADPWGSGPDCVRMSIAGGTYLGTVESSDCEGFIRAGAFSSAISSRYLAEGRALVPNENSGIYSVVSEDAPEPEGGLSGDPGSAAGDSSGANPGDAVQDGWGHAASEQVPAAAIAVAAVLAISVTGLAAGALAVKRRRGRR